MTENSRRITALLFVSVTLLLTAFFAFRDERWRTLRKQTEEIVLPVLSISTEGDRQIKDRETYIKARMSICGAGEYDLSEISCSVRGRGNSTWDFCEKKSYKIKLENKENLLGIGKGGEKDWALISNAREKSMLRNYAMLDLAKEIGVYPVTGCTFVQVTFNGEYIGLYLLTETPEEAVHRLSFGKDGEGDDVGYLMELDKRAKDDADDANEYFYINDWQIPVRIKSDECGMSRNAFIKSYMEAFDDAVMSGDRESVIRLADLDSIVNIYLLEEFSKDRDVGFSSFYMYKMPGGRLYFGYPWDFDMALGNDSGEDRIAEGGGAVSDYKSPEGLTAAKLNRWFEALMKCEWFRTEAAARWEEIGDAVDECINRTATVGFAIASEAEKNYERWRIMGRKQLFEPLEIVFIGSYTGQVEYLADWMTDRKEWLDGYFSGLRANNRQKEEIV